MQPSPFHAVIFDCDGVLVDSERLGLRSLQLALREAGVERSVDSLTCFSGRSHSETLAQLEAECGRPLPAATVAKRMDEWYMKLASQEGLRACRGVRHFLSWLSIRRIPFTLASSGPRRKVLFSLRSAGLESHFPQFICGEDTPRAKPAPDIYLAAARSIAVDPAKCVVVEDAPNGIKSARAAGMHVIAVTTTFAASALADADAVVETMLHLPRYLKRRPFVTTLAGENERAL